MRTRRLAVCILCFFTSSLAFAQSGTSHALNQASQEIRGYFNDAMTIFYACCAIAGLIGAFKVYSKWSSGDPDTTKVAAGWIAAIIFAIAAVNIVKAAFLG